MMDKAATLDLTQMSQAKEEVTPREEKVLSRPTCVFKSWAAVITS